MAVERENELTPELLVDSTLPLGLLPVPAYKDPKLIAPVNSLSEPDVPTTIGLEVSLPFIWPRPFSELPPKVPLLLHDIASTCQIPTFESGNRANRTIPKVPKERFVSYSRNTTTGEFFPTLGKESNLTIIKGVYGSPMMGRSFGLKPELTSAIGISHSFGLAHDKLRYIEEPSYTITIKGT